MYNVCNVYMATNNVVHHSVKVAQLLTHAILVKLVVYLEFDLRGGVQHVGFIQKKRQD